jgi:hypothetical protein
MKRQAERVSNFGNLVGPELPNILDRISAFFIAAGVEPAALTHQMAISVCKVAATKKKIRFVPQSNFQALERIVTYWLKHPSYVNAVGRPRPLTFSGKYSISTIVGETGFDGTAAGALRDLMEFGAVTESVEGTYSLTARHCNFSANGTVAYEPHVAFLMNAVDAATHVLDTNKNDHRLFWRASSSQHIPAELAEQYMDYIRVFGTNLLRELDDWFGKHDEPPKKNSRPRPRTIMGVGLFPFIQHLTVGNSEARAVVKRGTKIGVGRKKLTRAAIYRRSSSMP